MRNTSDIIDDMSNRINLDRELLKEVVDLLIECVEEALLSGESVRLRGLCNFYVYSLPSITLKMPDGTPFEMEDRVRIKPRMALRLRGYHRMTEEGMEKYGVVLDDEKVKMAEEGNKAGTCPTCGKELDESGLCPEHGTEPLERR